MMTTITDLVLLGCLQVCCHSPQLQAIVTTITHLVLLSFSYHSANFHSNAGNVPVIEMYCYVHAGDVQSYMSLPCTCLITCYYWVSYLLQRYHVCLPGCLGILLANVLYLEIVFYSSPMYTMANSAQMTKQTDYCTLLLSGPFNIDFGHPLPCLPCVFSLQFVPMHSNFVHSSFCVPGFGQCWFG